MKGILQDLDSILNNYFNDLKSRKHHSNLSWENCYTFFYNNRNKILNDETLLEAAALQLAFYLASWGMYRGSAFIRNYDHTVFKDLIKELLTNCKNLWTDDITWDDLKNANDIVNNYFDKNTPSQTLITKILMGVFGCVPAYDRYFITALRKHNETTKKENHICQTYNEESFNTLVQWWKKQKCNKKRKLQNSSLIYPPMKLADVYFWSEGKRLEKENNK